MFLFCSSFNCPTIRPLFSCLCVSFTSSFIWATISLRHLATEWLLVFLFIHSKWPRGPKITCEPAPRFLTLISHCRLQVSEGAVWCNPAATRIITVRGARILSDDNVVWHRLCSRLSASKPKYTFDFSEEEEGDEEENGGDDDAASSPVRSFKDDFPSSGTKEPYSDHDDDDDNEVSYSPPKQKPT